MTIKGSTRRSVKKPEVSSVVTVKAAPSAKHSEDFYAVDVRAIVYANSPAEAAVVAEATMLSATKRWHLGPASAT